MSNPLSVGVIWQEYSPKLEARLMMDAMKILSESNGVAFQMYLHESMPVESCALAIRMLARVGVNAVHRNLPEGEAYDAVLQYAEQEAYDLPLDMYSHNTFTTLLSPKPRNDVGPVANTDPEPPTPLDTTNSPYPEFRTRIPQGVSSLLALPAWAFLKPGSSP